MDYKVGQPLYIANSASLYGIRVKNSFQILNGSFISKEGTTVCVKLRLDSTEITETLLCIEENKVFDNFQKAVEHIHTTPVSTS